MGYILNVCNAMFDECGVAQCAPDTLRTNVSASLVDASLAGFLLVLNSEVIILRITGQLTFFDVRALTSFV